MKNEVRIIGGKWRGRKLRFPDRAVLRPSLGRVRETLFNWLVADVAGATCLDAYAGSGSLGFEAASRGAAHVVMLDNHRPTVTRLKASVAAIGASCVHVIGGDVRRYLDRADNPFDIVFLDPPRRIAGTLPAVLDQIAARDLLAPDGRVFVDLPAGWSTALPGWRWVRDGKAGDCRFGLLARGN